MGGRVHYNDAPGEGERIVMYMGKGSLCTCEGYDVLDQTSMILNIDTSGGGDK